MKKILLMAIFALSLGTVSAQEQSKNTSKWREIRNGKSYQMAIESKNSNKKADGETHLALKIEGDVTQLSKLSLTQKNQMMINLPVSKEAQDIKVEPGLYTFKLYHKNLGEKAFEVEIKKGDDKEVLITLK